MAVIDSSRFQTIYSRLEDSNHTILLGDDVLEFLDRARSGRGGIGPRFNIRWQKGGIRFKIITIEIIESGFIQFYVLIGSKIIKPPFLKPVIRIAQEQQQQAQQDASQDVPYPIGFLRYGSDDGGRGLYGSLLRRIRSYRSGRRNRFGLGSDILDEYDRDIILASSLIR